jgi:hypothetical protein
MENDLYQKYIKVFGDTVSLEGNLYASRRSLEEIRQMIKDEDSEGKIGLEFSAHAIKQIAERLEIIANENTVIYEDVLNTRSPAESILWPSNTKSFILGIMAKAMEMGNVTPESSRSNNDGFEFHYKVEIKKWSTPDRKLIFVGIVENGVIKTGYFNWM